jgi:exodeoxyribonuclease V alpha subunit
MDFDPTQERAIETALASKFSIITGGAGTGKTTIVKAIADESPTATLCAPTGKAAARLREATGHPSRTIHSTLGYNGAFFSRESLKGTHVIVDESSMIDSWLMASIIERDPDKLTLVGDHAQLFPVGAGAPFHNMIQFKPDVVSNLTTCYRSSEAVCEAGNLVRAGEFPGYELSSPDERWSFMKANNAGAAQDIIIQMIEDGLIDFEQDIIICPKNGAFDKDTKTYPESTVNGLNPRILDIVNLHEYCEKFAVGDRVICTKNFAEEDVWNGTTGTISSVDHASNIWVRTDTPTRNPNETTDAYRDEVKFTPEMTRATNHAYALTIHKAQGSQYRKVVVVCLSRDHVMLSRPLIYTAITRAQKECIVVGDRKAFDRALESMPERKTVIQEIVNANQDQS